jgi:hypothetical protein
MACRAAVLVLALLLASLATVDAQTTPAAPAAPTPGNPSSPNDFSNNPHPAMPWFGVATPYGQFVRWVWMPARTFDVGGRIVEQPGYWVAQTTSGFYHVDHWALAQGPTGELTWRMVPRAFQPR